MLGNLALKLIKTKNPMRLFNKEEAAVQWLLEKQAAYDMEQQKETAAE